MEASTYSPVGNIGTLMSLNDDTLQEILQSYDDFCAAAKSLLNGSRDLSFEHDFFSHVQTLCKHGLRSLARDYFLRSLEETFEKNGASRFWRHFENYSKIEEDLYKIDEDEIQTVLCNALEEICLEKENQEKCLLMLVHALQSYVDNLSNEKPNFDVGKDYLFSKYQLVVSSMLMANLPPHFPKVLHFYFKGRLEELNIVIDGEWNEENERPDRDKMHLDEKSKYRTGEMDIDECYSQDKFSENNKLVKNIGKVVCDLRNLGFTSMTEDAYASAIFMLLKAKVHDLAGDDYRSSVLDSIKGWIQVVPLQFLNALLAYLGDSISFVQHSPGTESPLASQPSSGYFGTSTPSSGLIRWKLRLEYFAYETLQDLRIAKLFEIIVDYPDSSPAIEDLKQCLKYTGQHSKLVLRTIDPAGVFLEAVGEPIRDYLRGRKDTIKCIVTMLTDGTSGNPNGSGDSGVSLLEELNRDVEGDDCVPAMAVDREEPVEFSRQKVISWLNKGHNSDMNGVSGGQAASRKSNAENSNCGLSGSVESRDNVSSDQEVVSKKRKEVLEDYQGSLKEGSVSNLSVRERMSVLRDGTSSGTMVVDRNLIKESSLDSSKYSIQEFSRAKNSMNRRRLRMAPCHSGSVCSEGEVESKVVMLPCDSVSSFLFSWEPDPVAADPSKGSRNRRKVDILGMIVGIIGSKDQLVNEYRVMLAEKLLNKSDYDID
ncbi:Anaphase-promoting complex subunit 2 [Hibiscus syriacus]|uniref:Anaphase-promoting complex subunit 2 n=1 Tax=Hibiscus syriacus TaxID=106335 RepID=A0A6A3CKI9_HIBSY|nr:Anaphase-promoting complex subunit 2 [Hibiscus syriacus]